MYAKEVTNGQFQRFVKANPQWQKDRVDAKFADKEYYLNDWASSNCPEGELDHPVTWISWYAAKGGGWGQLLTFDKLGRPCPVW